MKIGVIIGAEKGKRGFVLFLYFFNIGKKFFIGVFNCGGFMKDYLVKVGDQFRVEERLKEIDSSYEVFYNKKVGRFEVYSTKGGARNLAFVSPFDTLDARLVRHARATRAERFEKIISEVEENNRKFEEKALVDAEKSRQEKIAELKKRLKQSGKV